MKSLVGKLLIGFALVAVGALAALVAVTSVSNFSLFGTDSESRSTQLTNSITREEQVVLLSLGIQGIEEKKESNDFFGVFGERTKFIQYTFDAKLGIEGKDVVVTQTGENDFLVSIPKFIFIGHSNEDFRLIAENNGILSFVTPEIDSVEMVNSILSLDVQNKYVERNEEILKDQARAFYKGIIASIDPAIDVWFKFS